MRIIQIMERNITWIIEVSDISECKKDLNLHFLGEIIADDIIVQFYVLLYHALHHSAYSLFTMA